MEIIDYLRILGSAASLLLAFWGFIWIASFILDPVNLRKMHPVWSFILPIISVAYIAGMIFLSVWLGAPYSGDSSEKHSPDCDKNINGLWLPGRPCSCGATKD